MLHVPVDEEPEAEEDEAVEDDATTAVDVAEDEGGFAAKTPPAVLDDAAALVEAVSDPESESTTELELGLGAEIELSSGELGCEPEDPPLETPV